MRAAPSHAAGRRAGQGKPFEPNALLYRPGQAARFLGVGTTRFYELRKDARFPRPVMVGISQVPMYRREDLVAWVRGLTEAS